MPEAPRPPVRPRVPRVAAACCAALVVLLTVLAGCSGLPTSGGVVSGPEDVSSAVAPRILADPPSEGMTPRGIVEGFLRAAAAVEDDYAVARQYLTDQEAASWRPTASTVVYTDGALRVEDGLDPARGNVPADAACGTDSPDVPGASVGTRCTVHVIVPVEGTLDAHGRWQTAPPGTVHEVLIDVVQVTDSDSWRIADVPDQVLIGEDAFRTLYRSYQLYFLDSTRTALVPEVRWFPGRPASATLLAAELLAGPSEWLADAVTTAFPPGTALAQPATVPLEEDGTAVVELTSAVRRADMADRVLMQQQLLATLRPVPQVSDVRMTVAGDALEIVPAAPALRRDPGVPDPPVGLAGGRVVRIRPGGLEQVPGLPDLTGQQPSDPVVGESGLVALLTHQGSRLVVHEGGGSPGDLDTVLRGTDLTAPSIDAQRWVWTSPATSPGTVFAVQPDGSVRTVQAPFLLGRQVLSLRISRDGARAVISSTTADGVGHLDVAGVVREDGAPVALTPAPDAPLPRLTSGGDAVWVDQTTVALLVPGPTTSAQRVWVVAVDGSTSELVITPPGVVGLTAGRGSRSLLLETADGEVLQRSGSAWIPVPGTQGVRDPAYTS